MQAAQAVSVSESGHAGREGRCERADCGSEWPPVPIFGATSPGVIGDDAATLALAWGAYPFATLWLWAGAPLVARRELRLG